MLEGCDAVTYQNWVGKTNRNSKPLQITSLYFIKVMSSHLFNGHYCIRSCPLMPNYHHIVEQYSFNLKIVTDQVFIMLKSGCLNMFVVRVYLPTLHVV